MFHHEDFGGQLLWALQHYVSIDEEGPQSAFFNPTPLQGQGAAGAALPANRNMSKSKGWTLQSSLLTLWMEKTRVNNQTKIDDDVNLLITL